MLENYTNLSEYFLLTSIFAASAAFAVGIVIAFRLLPIFRQSAGHKLNQTTSALDALPASDAKEFEARQRAIKKKRNSGL